MKWLRRLFSGRSGAQSAESEKFKELYVRDWSPVPPGRYEQAQEAEREYWTGAESKLLTLSAQYYFYAGFYQWTTNRALLYPFSVSSASPGNFQIAADEIEGKCVVDVGCGPTPLTLSLVHCARVHAVDPLLDFYRELQPFGWRSFASLQASGAEQLGFADESVDFVHCRNVLDHTRAADDVLREIARVLRPTGQLLLTCDVRNECDGGPPHPYAWRIDTLERRVLEDFTPKTEPLLIDREERPVSRIEISAGVLTWVCRLKKNASTSASSRGSSPVD
jgi:SAM-dependent methyltransferase